MTDAYIKNKYGITLAEREAIMEEQDYKCSCCGRDLRECRIEVDHEHITTKMVFVCRTIDPKGWAAEVIVAAKPIHAWAKTKAAAIKAVKQLAKRASVRGILCGGRFAGCNRRLGRIDNVNFLLNTVQYLQDPPARRVLKG